MANFIRLIALLALFSLSSLVPVSAQEKKLSVFQRLSTPELPKLTLELDLTTVRANKKTNTYFPASLITEDGKKYEVEVRPRGKYRRKTCVLPPLKIKFKKKALKADGLDTLNEIKLGLPCFETDAGGTYVVKEHLVYKMLETVTSASVKTKLVKLTLVDTHTGKKSTNYAMLLEDEEETAARLGGQIIEQYGLPLDSLQINQLALTVMFEYMVGNTDWDLSMIRNVRTIKSKDSDKIVVIPYDFDFSGFVSAPYASPSSESGLKNVRERFLFSNGLDQAELQKATKRLLAARKDILAICRSKYLTRDESNEITSYLESFFLRAESDANMPTTMKAPPTD